MAMRKNKGLTLFELTIAVVCAIVITLTLIVFNRLNTKNTKFSDHITNSHGIDCSVNAATRKQCAEFGISNQ